MNKHGITRDKTKYGIEPVVQENYLVTISLVLVLVRVRRTFCLNLVFFFILATFGTVAIFIARFRSRGWKRRNRRRDLFGFKSIGKIRTGEEKRSSSRRVFKVRERRKSWTDSATLPLRRRRDSGGRWRCWRLSRSGGVRSVFGLPGRLRRNRRPRMGSFSMQVR